jgi:hypothetical protein
MMEVSVKSRCGACNAGEPVGRHKGVVVHSARWADGRAIPGTVYACHNFDAECRHGAEGFGFYIFAWLPRRRRNGKLRWLTWVEDHLDGTFTLGNRAH